MIRTLLLFCGVLLFSSNLSAQNFKVTGTITDADSKETLIGVNVLAGSKGVVTDYDGKFLLELPNGDYNVTFSYVGYDDIRKSITVAGADQTLDIAMGSGVILDQVTVVADIARERETPVAFSNIPTLKLEEELAAQDIPMILNSTPGAYATQSGGGDGDARITIRGFNQRNVAVMLDGIPVNDMENGWVFWSNWFGLDLVTKTMQVQRGLGASKLAIPSVGGTINILTKGIESDFGVKFRQEVGNNGYLRSTIGVTSGRLKNGWGISAAASYKQGNGWVDQTWTEGYFYYLRLDKEFGKHLISMSGFGAPQSHGQRSFKSSIATWDSEYALELGAPQSSIDDLRDSNLGLRYNEHWGNVSGVPLNSRVNFYHKPQISLRHSYNGSSDFFLSNVAYLSIGTGGGTGVDGSFDPVDDGSGLINFDKAVEANEFTSPLFKPEPFSQSIIRASINNHFWVGLLSTARYSLNENLSISGGVDLRYYRGTHTREVHNLLGGDYFFSERNARIDERNTKLVEGDRYFYDNDGFVQWGGLFSLLEYKNEKLSAFVNLSVAGTGYKLEDYMFHKTFTLDNETFFVSYDEPIEQNGVLYTVDNPSQESIDYATDNSLTLDKNTPQNQVVDWTWIPSFTFKTGASFKLDAQNSVFVNTGYLSRATRFSNVIDDRYDFDKDLGTYVLIEDFKNEEILAFELGYSFKSSKFSANINGYYTKWNNKPLDSNPTVLEDPTDPESDRIPVNINGVAALHKGIELDFAYKASKKLTIEGLASVADWIWNSSAITTLEDGSTYEFDAQGVHVGDAAQIQFGGMIRYEPIKGLYIKAKTTYFGKNFSNFEPESLKGINARRESWKMPDYNLIDFHAGYNFNIKDVRAAVRFNVLNAFDARYITDAQNNDRFTQSFNEYDAKSASVFFGQGRRWTTSLQLTF